MRQIIWILLVAALALIGGCSSEEGTTPPLPQETTGLHDGQGESVDKVISGGSAYWLFKGLDARTQYNFNLTDHNATELAKARLTTDDQGKVPMSAIGYDLGLGVGLKAADIVPGINNYRLLVTDLVGTEVAEYLFDVDTTTPMVFAANSNGDALNSFLRSTHSVYAQGLNLTPGATVTLYVVDDVMFWEDGATPVDVSGGAETVTVDAQGEILRQVWASPNLVAPYDIVADLDNNGVLDIKTDLVDGYLPTGFMVQVLGTGVDIQVQIACDASRNYKDIFEIDEHVYAALNPQTQQFTHKWVHKYVVVHQDIWNNGDALVDVSGDSELDTPQYGCTNEGRVLIWPRNLTPGKYDIVIDVNRDGIYTKGTDFLDNIDSYGFPTAGFMVPQDGNAPVVDITSPTNNFSTVNTTVTLNGTVSDSTVTNARLIVNGNAQTIGVTNRVMDQTTIILQRGQNIIRVEAFNESGLGFDQVVVNSTRDAVGMKVTLTWDVGPSNDVDLWVQDPTGEWCGWTNRNTAIGGWLDVDDTEGWGPENYFAPQDSVASHPGTYNVAVYYFDDAGEGATNPTIRVTLNEDQSTQFERTLNGPVLNAEGEWWFVTTITMPTGTFSEFAGPGPSKKSMPVAKNP
ncbi:MAG: hypothetical protein ABIF77_04005 [bacterium]